MTSADNSKKLPDDVVANLKAIVFDTNSFPAGGLDIDVLRTWERRAGLAGIEVWIPEPIVWELAEHAATHWDTFRASIAKAKKAMRAAGLEVPADLPYGSRDEIIEKIQQDIREIGPALRVLNLDGEIAREALMDQILQRPPAKKKSDVKTGASDSAWLLQVLKEAGHDVAKFLIVGSDRDVYSAFKAWGLETPRMIPLQSLRQSLFVLEKPEAEVMAEIATFLAAIPPSALEGGRSPDESLQVGQISGFYRIFQEQDYDSIQDISLTRIEAFAGLRDLAIDRLAGTATATAFFIVEAEYSSWGIGEDGDASVDSAGIGDVLLRDLLTFSLRDGSVSKAESETGQSEVSRASEQFDTGEDAFRETLEAISLVPGLNDAGSSEPEIGADLCWHLNGWEIRFESSGDGDGWNATLTLEKGEMFKSVRVVCEFDSSANPWEYPDMFPAYPVFVFGDFPTPTNSEWALPVFIISTVWGPQSAQQQEHSPTTTDDAG